ncbi:DivIVA domain-containing protein [Pelotomaculum propionicicum]|uniref:Septum site-determining protein DivIVA n=1 Tax=Pelotomaculum propionicicum TaxID=258475 RepID=A0A4Y7RMS5_9FIRM|nr:DivIVA domain-containing protein [Pelotomaculum propionicicum]NLI12868.1 DivIVA domain-containing protein [Peptococcaceae bacterium]TEB10294.1 Septum site-determining protein DivIVA [Pelotomaculum propionicicum]
MLTPLDIQKKEFRRVFRGYSEEEVDSFLDQVTQDYENLLREIQALKDKINQYEQNITRYREIEEAIKNTMVMAQKNADELRQNTEKEAGVILDRARIEAAQLTREAEQEAAALLAEAETKLRQIMEEQNQCKRESQIFKIRLRSFLEAQMKLLEDEGTDFSDSLEDEDISETA